MVPESHAAGKVDQFCMDRPRNYPAYHIISFLSLMFVLLVPGCGEEDPHPPIIFSLAAEPDIVPPGEASTLTVEAGDEDRDEISYLWSASGGRVEGSGKTVTWISPEVEGQYVLTVTVSDDSDSVTQTVTVWVWTPRPGDYYPLAVGNTWAFQDNNGNSINFEIIDTIDISGTTAFVKEMTTSELPDAVNFSYITRDADGVHQHALGGSNAGGDTIIFSPVLPLYRFPLIPGESWELEFGIKLPEGYFVGDGRAVYEVVSEEELTVGAGTFQHVFQVKEDFTWELLGQKIDHIITHHWVAPNVGIVKFVQEETIGEQTVITEATLKSYLLE